MDKQYWDSFYAHRHTMQPTPFAVFCLERLPKRSVICELGCGNGRDSFYFAEHGHTVIAVDQSAVAIALVVSANRPGIRPLCSDMTALDGLAADVVYSRFSFHAITDADEIQVLDWAAETLPEGGRLCIEARSDVGAFEGDHYRRFMNREAMQGRLQSRGFHFDFIEERAGWAVYRGEDPVVTRIVARRAAD